jgi:hypothetical protein
MINQPNIKISWNLKKNCDIKDYIIMVVLDNTTEGVDKTVKKVLDLLAEKYAKTTTEKSKEVFDKILKFKMEEDETCEKYWDRFQSLITDCDRENLRSKFYYLMVILFIDEAGKNGKINSEEMRRLKEVIEKDNDNDRVSKAEGDVVKQLKQEFKKLKIKNNRDPATTQSLEDTNVHYGENRSRWTNWQDLKTAKFQ